MVFLTARTPMGLHAVLQTPVGLSVGLSWDSHEITVLPYDSDGVSCVSVVLPWVPMGLLLEFHGVNRASMVPA